MYKLCSMYLCIGPVMIDLTTACAHCVTQLESILFHGSILNLESILNLQKYS